MRNLTLLIICMMFLTNIIGQTKTKEGYEQQAYYKKGGIEGFQKYISSNFKLPESKKLVDADGKMVIVFVVDSTGGNYIENVYNTLNFRGKTGEYLKNSFVADCELEIRRIFTNMPKWIPGTQNGVPVKARFTFPLNIRTK